MMPPLMIMMMRQEAILLTGIEKPRARQIAGARLS